LRGALRRDLKRYGRRQVGAGAFWRSMRVLGIVGWPIAIGAAGGAWLGHVLDRRWHTGIACTLILLFTGTVVGSLAAWRGLKQDAS
jgi:predicted F0F1-ATPase subunit